MPTDVKPHVQLIAWTNFQAPVDVPWDTHAEGAPVLAEFVSLGIRITSDTSWRRVTCPC